MRTILVALCVLANLGGMAARATELKPDTAAAFDRYVRAMEARMDEETGRDQFLVVVVKVEGYFGDRNAKLILLSGEFDTVVVPRQDLA